MENRSDVLTDSTTTQTGEVHLDYAQLVERAHDQCDRAASDMLADDLYPKVWAVARGYSSDESLLEDMVQEAMFTIFRRFYRYDRTRLFIPWALRIAEGRFKDMLRRQNAQRRSAPQGIIDEPPRQRANPEEELMRAEEARRLHEALLKLPKVERQIISLHWFGGVSYETIAHDFELDRNQVYQLSYTARQRLGKMLKESEDELS